MGAGKKIWFEGGRIWLELETGERSDLPLKAFPRLYNATDEQRRDYTLSPFGVHWPSLDEDLNFDGFFRETEEKNETAMLFDRYPEINVSRFAKSLNINPSLLAKYICGVRKPSEGRKTEIIEGLHRLGRELASI